MGKIGVAARLSDPLPLCDLQLCVIQFVTTSQGGRPSGQGAPLAIEHPVATPGTPLRVRGIYSRGTKEINTLRRFDRRGVSAHTLNGPLRGRERVCRSPLPNHAMRGGLHCASAPEYPLLQRQCAF